jgi:hypothetical protein
MNFVLRSQNPARPRGLRITAKFVTAADFGARPCRTWQSEIKKNKPNNRTAPAAGINFLLCEQPQKLFRGRKTVHRAGCAYVPVPER